jgi:hypothetical protein
VDTRTGHVVLNGVVTEGQNLGARVEVRAQANATLTCSSGTMTIHAQRAGVGAVASQEIRELLLEHRRASHPRRAPSSLDVLRPRRSRTNGAGK